MIYFQPQNNSDETVPCLAAIRGEPLDVLLVDKPHGKQQRSIQSALRFIIAHRKTCTGASVPKTFNRLGDSFNSTGQRCQSIIVLQLKMSKLEAHFQTLRGTCTN